MLKNTAGDASVCSSQQICAAVIREREREREREMLSDILFFSQINLGVPL
jgi:hypothetical protein